MYWINLKHTAASQCSIILLAVWTMRKDFHGNTEWNMSIMGWVCGFLSHLSKSRCVRKLCEV